MHPRFNNIHRSPVSSESKYLLDMYIDADAAFSLMQFSEYGPQSTSVTREDLLASANSPDTVVASVKGINVPILLPILNIESFRSSGYFKGELAECLFLPVYSLLTEEELNGVKQQLKDRIINKPIVAYYEDGNLEAQRYTAEIISALSPNYSQKTIVDNKNDTNTGVIHFEGLAVVEDRLSVRSDIKSLRQVFLEGVEEGVYEVDPYTGTTIINPNKLQEDGELLDKLWNISNQQFSVLVENLPIRQNPSREEFDEIMTHPDTTSIVYFEDGEPICLTTFLHSIEPAQWLRKQYFTDKFGEDAFIAYFAFMVSDPNKATYKSSHKVLKMLVDLTVKSKSDMQVLFECTNISATYIPKLVESVVNSSDDVKIDIAESSSYTFRIFEIGTAE